MTTVALVGCATVVKVVRGRLDEACAMAQPMTTQTMMGMITKSTIDPTVAPTIIPTILLAGERNMKIPTTIIIISSPNNRTVY